MRFPNPEQALFQLGSASKSLYAIVGEGAAQVLYEREGKTFPLVGEHAEIGKKVSLRAGGFPSDGVVGNRLMLE
jgi:hypothetical protein